MSDIYDENKENKDLEGEKPTEERQDASSAKKAGKSDNNEYEDVCFICRRPESRAGKMFKLPNNICICGDCMH